MDFRFEDLLERLEHRRNQKEYSRGLAAHGILYIVTYSDDSETY
jgi:hypothetical protein